MKHSTHVSGDNARLVERLVFFSDAVFAIVLTLLALELRLPEEPLRSWGDMQAALGTIGPHLLAFTSSFALISIFWLSHMQMMRRLHVFDWTVAACNLVFLFTVSCLPFVTATAATQGWAPPAFALYASVIVAASIANCVLLLVVTRDDGALIGGLEPRERMGRLVRAASPGLAFSIGIAAMVVAHSPLGYFAWALIGPLMWVTSRYMRGPKVKAAPLAPPPLAEEAIETRSAA